MNLIIASNGRVRGVFGEEIDLAALGSPMIKRASHVEADEAGRWLADLAPVGGPALGPFDRRSEALEAEVAWLEVNWLLVPECKPPSTRRLNRPSKIAASLR